MVRFQTGGVNAQPSARKKSAFAFKDPLQQVALYW